MKHFRHIFAACASVCICCVASAQTQEADTIKVLNGIQSVLLTKDGDITTITVETKDKANRPGFTYVQTTETVDIEEGEADLLLPDLSQELPFVRTKVKHHKNKSRHNPYSMVWGRDLYVGALVPVDNEDGFTTCWHMGIGQLVAGCWQPMRGGTSFTLGAGLSFRQLKLNNRYIFASLADGLLRIDQLPQGMDRAKTRLNMWCLELPLSIRQPLGGDFAIEFSGALTYNFYTRASSDYRTADNEYRYQQEFKHLHQRSFGLDLRFAFGWTDIVGFYIRYSPVSVFCSGYGPQTDLLGAGISLGF